MASLRDIKKDINYLCGEVIYDCYMAMYFNSEKKDEILKIIEEDVNLRNEMIEMANHPAEKHNPSLVRKHYRFVRSELMERIDGLFEKLSNIVNAQA